MRRDESGQSLLVIVSSMTVLLAMAGFGIDTASWMVRHHNAQVVADSAALAAAQCLASPNQSSTMFVDGAQTTVPKCTSSTDSADAQTVAVDYAAANGLAITAANVSVDTTKKVVTVTATTTSPGIFAKVFGMASSTQSAQAGAGWKPGGGCTTAGQNCDFMFANSDSCPGIALNVATQGASTINGDIQTNGGLDASATGNGGGIYGTGNFGPGACTSTTGGNHDPWQTSQPTQASSIITWPIDYSKDFPACGGNGEPACVNGYPSFCTNESTNSTIPLNNQIVGDQPSAGQVYCAIGPPPANPHDPSTWTGSITLNMSGNNPIEDTFVAGTISYTGTGGDTISPCGYTASGYSSSTCSAPAPAGNTSNYPVFYATGLDPNPTACAAGTNVATSCAFSITSGGNLTLDGDTFIENGTASLNFQGNQSAGNTFFEANSITATLNGNFNGDGPPPSSGGGGGGSGSVSLVQ
jgi:hypothetical protein